MRDVLPVFEGLSWYPFRLYEDIRDRDSDRVYLDLNRFGVDRRFWLSLPPSDTGLSKQLRVFGFREPLNCQCYAEFIDGNDILLDIGSNIGFFVILGSDAKRIICVEPLESVIELLRENIEMNGLSEKCEIVHAAVGPRGHLLLEVSDHLNLSRIVSEPNENTVEVESISLGDLAERYSPTAIRLDVEGFEFSMLYNQIPSSVKKISMEFHTGLMGEKKSKKLLSYFTETGFRVEYLIEDVPLRLYPFVRLIRNTAAFKFVSRIHSNVEPENLPDLVFSGRSLKHLYLRR